MVLFFLWSSDNMLKPNLKEAMKRSKEIKKVKTITYLLNEDLKDMVVK